MKECLSCKQQNTLKAKFCNNCGASFNYIYPKQGPNNLPDTTDQHRQAERRQLTIMFCDLVGSTALSDRLDPEDFRQVILDYQQLAEKVIRRYGGHVAQYLGDGLLVYFGYPKGQEDAPKAGVRSGLGILEAIGHANLKWEASGKTTICVRIGVHTGLVVVDDHLALGDTTNIAARLEALAPVNGLVISPQTLKLVQGWFEAKSIGEHVLKGIAKPMKVFQVLHETGARTRLEIAKGKGLSPLVGRDHEHQLLRDSWKQAKRGKGNLVLLKGEAGIGKSRLVDTLKEEIAEEPGSWLTELRCSSYHQNSAFYPIIDLLENVALQYKHGDTTESKLNKLEGFLIQSGIEQKTGMPLFAEFLAISSPDYPPPVISPAAKKQHLMKNLTQGLLHRASVQPVLLVVEDLHWADASTLEWLQLLLEQLPTQPIFALCTTRPGFQAAWMDNSLSSLILLQRLPSEKVTKICHHQTNGKKLPKEILEQVSSKTEGVPLFVEELTKMVLESELLLEKDDHYEIAGVLPALAIPSTLQDSLLARLDKLSAGKEVVQIGAVLGREFSLELLNATLGQAPEKHHKALSQLVDAELFYQTGTELNTGYKFKHALIRDTAYESILKKQRQKLHRRVAQTLEKKLPDTIKVQPELAAYHYSKAGLQVQAIPLWLKAGRQASQKHANQEAISHLKMGLDLLPNIQDKDQRAKIELDFLLVLGGSYIVYYGYTHEKVGELFNRAIELAKSIKATDDLAYILLGLMVYYYIREDGDATFNLINYSLDLGANLENGYLFNLFGNHLLGVMEHARGNHDIATNNLQKALEIYNPEIYIPSELTPGGNEKINISVWLALNLQISGYPDRAKKLIKWANSLIDQNWEDSRTLYHICGWTAWRANWARDWEEAVQIMDIYLPKAIAFGDPFFIGIGQSMQRIAKTHLGHDIPISDIEKGINNFEKGGATATLGYFVAFLVELLYKNNQFEVGLSWIEKCLNNMNSSDYRLAEPEYYRLKGLILEKMDGEFSDVEVCFIKALEVSKNQSAKLFELRTACDLARYWDSHGKRREGLELLHDTYKWFTEGFDSVDLVEARALMAKMEN